MSDQEVPVEMTNGLVSEGASPLVSGPPGDDFVAEFTRSQRRLFLFILSQVGRATEAEEILQETNLVIWRKCRQFQAGTNFFGWAGRIATLEVLKYRDRNRRDRLCFSEGFLSQVAAEAADVIGSEVWDSRRKALEKCLGRLDPVDRELIEKRYQTGANGKSVAHSLGRPANSVYQSLGRIRRALFDCVKRGLAAEGIR